MSKKPKQKPLSWKPVKRGAIYCALACGYKCTWQAFVNAKDDARNTLNRMRNKKAWKVSIWENGGWHCSLMDKATNGLLTIHIERESQWSSRLVYYCMFRLRYPRSGDCRWTNTLSFFDPNKAVDFVLKSAGKILKHEYEMFESIRQSVDLGAVGYKGQR